MILESGFMNQIMRERVGEGRKSFFWEEKQSCASSSRSVICKEKASQIEEGQKQFPSELK